MKVFYSWQMDAPRKVNKDFIHGALAAAIEMIGEDIDVAEAGREAIQLDQDTQGVLGSPEIARVIFDKIAEAGVIVCDVSLVARGKDDKRHINSNVAIELGYAYGKLGDAAVLKVMNTHFGEPSDLPFDLRSRRHPVCYSIPPDANRSEVDSAQSRLATELASILRRYWEQRTPHQQTGHVETPYVGVRGRFWNSDEVLVPGSERSSRGDIYLPSPNILYFRCIPETPLTALTPRDAYEQCDNLRPLLSTHGFSRSRNRWGAISYDGDEDNLLGATQVFRNGEIWGVDTYYPNVTTTLQHRGGAKDEVRILPTGAIQRDYPRSIDSMRNAAARMGYGNRYTIEMGFSGAEGTYLAIDRRYLNSFPGPFYEDVHMRKSITADYDSRLLLNDFWDLLFSEVGRSVPEDLIYVPDEHAGV